MKFRIIGYTSVFLFFLFTQKSIAQVVYKAEVGFHTGISYYLGDANAVMFHHPLPDYGLVFRYNFNERLVAQAEFNNTAVTDGVDFNNTINAFDVCGEFNFFDFIFREYRPDSRKYSTYIYAGLGMMYYDYNTKPQLKFSYPFGVGFKFRLLDRLKMNIQWSQRLLLTDQMEGLMIYNNPSGLNGSNLMNNDLLSTFTIGLTYDIWKKGCNCNNNSY